MKKIKKKKIVLYFIISTLLISVGSVGFSSWILSIENKESNFSANINISEARNATAILDVNTSVESISSDGDTGNIENLNVPLSGSIIYSDDINSEISKSKLSISVNALSDVNNPSSIDSNKVEIKTTDTDTDSFGRTNGEEYTYFEVSDKEVSVSELTLDNTFNVSGYSKLNLSLEGFSLEYGSYFNYQNPETFYNEKIIKAKNIYLSNKNDDSLNTYLNIINKAKNELHTFFRKFDGQTLNIMVSLVSNSSN